MRIDLDEGLEFETLLTRLRQSNAPRNGQEIPTMYSPLAACLQGVEPEWVYVATFSCSLSMYAQASSSPQICIQLDTSRKPVPDEFGFGMIR